MPRSYKIIGTLMNHCKDAGVWGDSTRLNNASRGHENHDLRNNDQALNTQAGQEIRHDKTLSPGVQSRIVSYRRFLEQRRYKPIQVWFGIFLLSIRAGNGMLSRELTSKTIATGQYQRVYPTRGYLFEGQKGGPYSYASARASHETSRCQSGLVEESNFAYLTT
jgi:hypothetical protein